MRTLHRYALLLMLMIPIGIFAQQTVTGIVTEAETGYPMPGVNVVIKGTTTGTATDFDGNFSIEANTGDILVFTYIGFVEQEITVSGSTVNVAMQEDAEQLDEVVVIGYGTVSKKDATGAVNTVSAEDFQKGPIVSAQQLIQGKVAGVSVVSGSGAPGEGQTVRIRGNSSLTLNSDPLYVIDGIPLDNGGVGGSRNPLNTINPNDIESMTVLKDASATSIYGARAANGVVMITTKKGKVGDLKFNYRVNTSVYEPTNYIDVLSAGEFRALTMSTGNQNYINRLGNASTDWQDLIYTTAYGSDHSLSATGGIKGIPFRASLGYTDQGGILKDDSFERITGNLNLTPRLLDDALKLEINARFSNTKNNFANRDAIGAAVSMDPTHGVYDADSPFYAYTGQDGVDYGYFSWLTNDGLQNSNATTNPIALLNLKQDQATINRFIGNIKADYKVPFLEGLTATINAGYDVSDSEGKTITASNMPTALDGYDGARTDYTQNTKNYLLDAYLNYKKSFNEEKHTIDATVGYSYQRFEYDNWSRNVTRILNNDGSLNDDPAYNQEFIDKSRNVLLSYFGRVNYDYNNKYLVTATLRADASSKLNPDDRWGFFPSVALAWNVHNENFLKDGFFEQLKLRFGYGEVGNVSGLGDYRFLTQYIASTSTARYQFGDSFYQTYRPQPINEDLRWEVGNTINAGLDYTIFDGKVYGAFNAYIKTTKDLIATTLVDPFTNFSNRIDANIGDMENKGIEIEVGYKPVDTDDLTININYNVSFNENKITRLPDTQPVGGISGGTGNTIQQHEVGVAPYSFLVYKQIYDDAGNPIEGAVADLNGDGIINSDDRYYYKDPYADIIMGLNLNMRYKRFDFTATSRANFGNYAYNNTKSNSSVLGLYQNEVLYNTHSNILSTDFQNISDRTLLSDYYVENASFFRMDNITLGYTLPEAIKDNPLRVYVSANNLFVITNYSGIDPEITGGIDNNFYPRPKVFVLGLDINF
ncbi:SusC/RagA family TonB-linked outer membrane protein [Robertkochia solimangrovi]|uniref:SusC/RagA family TonB-linked outer membrane protein n=1 Tax=Robertkochia solimangrovi TaxID=2213046 RepID=UPI00117DA241|nr:TonB-dependent receptor [Robertkochia solimangrovi]TRZ43299.1 SusC/RagA family TonB-linked outer membrane protein [Robertkochia solimangrovi]